MIYNIKKEENVDVMEVAKLKQHIDLQVYVPKISPAPLSDTIPVLRQFTVNEAIKHKLGPCPDDSMDKSRDTNVNNCLSECFVTC